MKSLILNLIYDGKFYSALLQRQDEKGTTLAKHIFGAEPSDAELYEFTLKELSSLKFTEPTKMAENLVAHCKINYKRRLRMVKKDMRAANIKKETLTQESMRLELEKKAVLKRRKQSKAEREAERKIRFEQKQLKKKQKLKGR